MKRNVITRYATVLLFALTSSASYADDDNDIPFEVLRHGNLSGIDHQMIMVADNQMHFEHLWKMHSSGASDPTEDTPEINFEKEVVIGHFLGNSASCGYDIHITSVEDKKSSVQVKSNITTPSMPIQCLIAEQPFEFIVVPRQSKLFSFKQTTNKRRLKTHDR